MPARSAALIPFAAALAALAVYWPVLGLGFVWDDRILYVDVPGLRDVSSLWAGTVGSVIGDMHFFRPVALLTFKLQFLLFGESTVAAHAIGLALHVANTFLVAALAARLLPAAPARAAIGGLVYGLHPALVEPVSWMSCRFDLLVTLWLLLALHADCAIRRPIARGLATAGLYFLALNSKEMAAPFPAVLVLFQLATRYADVPWRERPARMLRGEGVAYALLVVAAAGYVALRHAHIGDAVDTDPDVLERLTGLPERAAFVASTALFHLRNVVWPFAVLNPLHPVDLDALAFTVADGARIAAVAALLLALGYGVWRRIAPVVLVAAGLLALFPVLNVLPISIGRNIGHERYLTFPLALFALALASTPLPPRSSPSFRLAGGLAGAVGLVWFGFAVAGIRVTVPLWQSEVSLWSWAASRHPDSDYAHHMVVLSLLHAQRLDLAAQRLTEPIPSTPYRALTQLEFARHLLFAGRYDAGAAYLRSAMQGFPPWHARPPQDPSDARDFEVYRGYVAAGYTLLAEVEKVGGNDDAARTAAALAQSYAGADSGS